jgi:hypothetical protein
MMLMEQRQLKNTAAIWSGPIPLFEQEFKEDIVIPEKQSVPRSTGTF